VHTKGGELPIKIDLRERMLEMELDELMQE
jgi:hypothetical protein